MVGSSIIPMVLSFTWARASAAGVVSGCVLGAISSFVAVVLTAAQQPEGLDKFYGKDPQRI